MKIMLLLAVVGHLICGITDCMFAYSKTGRFDFADIRDNEKMKDVFSAMPLRQLEIGMMLGVVALFLSSAGYLAVADWMKDYSDMAATIMKYSSLFFSDTYRGTSCFVRSGGVVLCTLWHEREYVVWGD